MAKADSVTHTFEPIFNNESKVLILGTFPSVKSREQQFYYGHPQNRFWKLLALLMEDEIRFFTEASDCRLGCHPQLYDRRIERQFNPGCGAE